MIPDHCNKNTSQYYQADNDISSHLVGSQTKDGGWYCDCDFVKSDSRTVNTSKITLGMADYSLSGKSDIDVNDYVFLYGASSGLDAGRVIAVDDRVWFGNKEFTNLYKISGIDFTDGDSGAPIIEPYGHSYGGMNIGEHSGYNYGHDWTFLKSKLGLRS